MNLGFVVIAEHKLKASSSSSVTSEQMRCSSLSGASSSSSSLCERSDLWSRAEVPISRRNVYQTVQEANYCQDSCMRLRQSKGGVTSVTTRQLLQDFIVEHKLKASSSSSSSVTSEQMRRSSLSSASSSSSSSCERSDLWSRAEVPISRRNVYQTVQEANYCQDSGVHVQQRRSSKLQGGSRLQRRSVLNHTYKSISDRLVPVRVVANAASSFDEEITAIEQSSNSLARRNTCV